MPTFPPSSLKFRTAGFPQYGFKAGGADGAFPVASIATAGLPPPFVLPLASYESPHCVEERGAPEHLRSSDLCRSTPGALAPVRVMLSRSILAYSAPCAPLASTSRFRRMAVYTRGPRCASNLDA